MRERFSREVRQNELHLAARCGSQGLAAVPETRSPAMVPLPHSYSLNFARACSALPLFGVV